MSKDCDAYHYCETLSRSSRLSDQVIGWSGRWSILGSFLICSRCLATQQVEESNEAFAHFPECDASEHFEHPWHELAELMSRLPNQHHPV